MILKNWFKRPESFKKKYTEELTAEVDAHNEGIHKSQEKNSEHVATESAKDVFGILIGRKSFVYSSNIKKPFLKAIIEKIKVWNDKRKGIYSHKQRLNAKGEWEYVK